MRTDFNKVLVNCYRVGGGVLKPGRLPRDLDDLPKREGIRSPYRRGPWAVAKDFGENLTPLFRFLDKQVGRPWDKVYSELCSTFDMRKTINQHILQHVNQYVEQEAMLEGSRVLARTNYGNRLYEVTGLYVHPENGLLCRAKKRGPTAREKEVARQREVMQVRRQVGQNKWLINYQGVWYLVRLADFPLRKQTVREVPQADGTVKRVTDSYEPTVHDVLFKRSNGFEPFTRDKKYLRDLCFEHYGTRTQYAVWKKQASHQELKRYGVI